MNKSDGGCQIRERVCQMANIWRNCFSYNAFVVESRIVASCTTFLSMSLLLADHPAWFGKGPLSHEFPLFNERCTIQWQLLMKTIVRNVGLHTFLLEVAFPSSRSSSLARKVLSNSADRLVQLWLLIWNAIWRPFQGPLSDLQTAL